eukprot:131880_1
MDTQRNNVDMYGLLKVSKLTCLAVFISLLVLIITPLPQISHIICGLSIWYWLTVAINNFIYIKRYVYVIFWTGIIMLVFPSMSLVYSFAPVAIIYFISNYLRTEFVNNP